MSEIDILEEEPLNIYQLKAQLLKIQKRDGELDFRENKTLEYLNYVSAKKDKSKDLFDALMGLKIPRLRDVHIHKVVDLMPTHEKDIATVLQGYHLTVTKDNMKKIVDTVKQFAEEA